jgi:hypothetical protein
MDERAQLDGWSFNTLALNAFIEYMQHHPIPNPQAELPRMLELRMPHKPISQCCVPGCRGKAKFLNTLRNYNGKKEKFQVCTAHRHWRHPEYRFLISSREMT